MTKSTNIKVIAYPKGELPFQGDDAVKVEIGNAALFKKPLRRYNAVYAPNYPKIEAAYVDIGVGIYRPDAEAVSEPVKAPENSTPVGEVIISNKEAEIEAEAVTEPFVEPAPEESEEKSENWRDLGWNPMRKLAAQFTEDPIKSKDHAIEVLEQAEAEGKI